MNKNTIARQLNLSAALTLLLSCGVARAQLTIVGTPHATRQVSFEVALPLPQRLQAAPFGSTWQPPLPYDAPMNTE